MAVQWMDNFSFYGGSVSKMLDGLYASANNIDLVADPDGVSPGFVLHVAETFFYDTIRKVLTTARTTVGVAVRHYCANLPGSTGPSGRITWDDVNALTHVYIDYDPSGNLRAWRNDTPSPVLLGATSSPVILAHAWQHIEARVILDAAAGSVQIRVEGVTVLNVTGVKTISNQSGIVGTCQNVRLGANGFSNVYFKDFIVWDDQTAFNNSFMGSCQVYRLAPDSDVALNWTPSPADGIGFDKINEANPDDDARYIAAPFPLPAAYKCGIGDLPATVTSVRSVQTVHRSKKVDGGDGNVQAGLVSGGSTGLGADRPITTAYTYWYDVFDANPNGAIAWTRTAVNALNVQLNRTV